MINHLSTKIDIDWDSSFLRHSLNQLYPKLRIAVIHGGNFPVAGKGLERGQIVFVELTLA